MASRTHCKPRAAGRAELGGCALGALVAARAVLVLSEGLCEPRFAGAELLGLQCRGPLVLLHRGRCSASSGCLELPLLRALAGRSLVFLHSGWQTATAALPAGCVHWGGPGTLADPMAGLEAGSASRWALPQPSKLLAQTWGWSLHGPSVHLRAMPSVSQGSAVPAAAGGGAVVCVPTSSSHRGCPGAGARA